MVYSDILWFSSATDTTLLKLREKQSKQSIAARLNAGTALLWSAHKSLNSFGFKCFENLFSQLFL